MPEIETTRLRLRHLTLADLDDLYRIYSNPEVMKYVGKGARTKNETQAALVLMIEHWQHGFGMWATIHKPSGKLIGRCGLCFLDNTPEIELGYTLDKPYWNMGLATEASLAILKYGFDQVGLERIVAIARPENIASQRVMQKVCMKYEKNAYYYDSDVVYYALCRADYYHTRN
ncbi:MAG TPA: N-acetyltransferase [Cyanobacteria bacterium UBA11049]|nr:N-acetyltransferase [Cyanobacteria bacterium UBA11049]